MNASITNIFHISRTHMKNILIAICFPFRIVANLHIVNEGRLPLLNYLRNLTPQAIILSFALIAGSKLEPRLFYWENTELTFSLFCFLAISLFAIWANSSIFMEEYLATYNKNINDESLRQKEIGVKGLKHLWTMLSFTWNNERQILYEVIIVYVIVQYGLVIVLMSAIGSATAFLNLKVLH